MINLKQNAHTLKFLSIGFLTLIMLIPLGMIKSVVYERLSLSAEAQHTISERWGGQQYIGGPVLTLVRQTRSDDLRQTVHQTSHYFLADSQDISATIEPEIRYLGIYEFPVYQTQVTIQSRLILTETLKLWLQDADTVSAKIWLPIEDVRGIRAIESAVINGTESKAEPLQLSQSIYKGIQFQLPETLDSDELDIQIVYQLAGSHALNLLPTAKQLNANINAPWPSPEFVGAYLPVERTIDEQSFQASWQVLGINRSFGNHWLNSQVNDQQLIASSFGARLYQPADSYQQIERSIKYAILFIALTFLALFLFEIFLQQTLHIIQYLFTGIALAIFYLLLLAFSEYMLFVMAYWIAAFALVVLVGGYCKAILGSSKRGLMIALMMTSVYLLLYFLLLSESYALLTGTLSLFAALSLIMYLTRHVNWGKSNQATD